jgi:hypothetical protein
MSARMISSQALSVGSIVYGSALAVHSIGAVYRADFAVAGFLFHVFHPGHHDDRKPGSSCMIRLPTARGGLSPRS